MSAVATDSASRRGEKGQALGFGFDGVDDQRCERRQMIGAAFDSVRPFALARPDVGSRQQFGQRHDAGEWRADVMRDAGKRGFHRARGGFLCRTLFGRPFSSFAFRHPLPRGQPATEAAFNRARRVRVFAAP
jgi:hypothetical protein